MGVKYYLSRERDESKMKGAAWIAIDVGEMKGMSVSDYVIYLKNRKFFFRTWGNFISANHQLFLWNEYKICSFNLFTNKNSK